MCARSLPLRRQILAPTWQGVTRSRGRTSVLHGLPMLSRCPLMLACSATDAASWDFFMPGGSVQETAYGRADRATHAQKWMAETSENETLTLNSAKHDLLMFASVIAVGAINGPLHFVGDDQAVQGIAFLSVPRSRVETPSQPSLSLCQLTALSLSLCCDPPNGTLVIHKAFASSQVATDRVT